MTVRTAERWKRILWPWWGLRMHSFQMCDVVKRILEQIVAYQMEEASPMVVA